MRKIKWICLMLVLLLALPLLFACQSGRRQSKLYFDLFDTVIEVICYREDPAFDQTCARIYEMLSDYHRLYDVYTVPTDGTVSLYTVNALAGTAPVKVDARILDLLRFCIANQAGVEHTVQITYGAVLSLWHTARETGVLPTTQAIAEAVTHTDPSDLVIDEVAGTVSFRDPHMRLDVGAVAKGYAVERVAEALRDEGITGYLINAGGNVRAIGPKHVDTPWQIEVSAPDGATSLGRVSCMNGSLVTSGSYHRFLEIDGRTYAHIIDPTTGMPAERYVSVTVQIPESDLGDLLSTALFVCREEEGRAIAAHYGAEVLWVYADGTMKATEGFLLKDRS